MVLLMYPPVHFYTLISILPIVHRAPTTLRARASSSWGEGQRPKEFFPVTATHSGEDGILEFVTEKNCRTSQVKAELEFTKRCQQRLKHRS